MTEATKRVAWIDVMKCIGITLVVIYHAGLSRGAFYGLESFAVPLFFFMAGYLFNPDVEFRSLVKRGFHALIKPYFFTIFIISVLYATFKDGPSFFWYLFWMFYANGPNMPKLALHLWFLPCLFVTTVFVWLSVRSFQALKRSPVVQFLFITGLLVFGYFAIRVFWNLIIPSSVTDHFITNGTQFLINGLLDNPSYSKAELLNQNQFLLKGLPWSLDTIFITSAFYLAGYAVRKNSIESFFQKGAGAWIALAIFSALLYFFNYQFDISLRQYDHLLFLTLQIIAGLYISMYLSNIIGNSDHAFSRAVKYIGKSSLIIYIFHPAIVKLTSQLIASLKLTMPDRIATLPAILAGMGIPLILNYVLLERFKFFRYWYYSK